MNTEPPTADNIADDAVKLNIVSHDWKSNPATVTSESRPAPSSEKVPAKAKAKARRYAHEAEVEGFHLWNVTKNYLFRPAVAGGLLGLRTSCNAMMSYLTPGAHAYFRSECRYFEQRWLRCLH